MPAKLHRCVKKVAKQKDGKDPWAICVASLNKKYGKKPKKA